MAPSCQANSTTIVNEINQTRGIRASVRCRVIYCTVAAGRAANQLPDTVLQKVQDKAGAYRHKIRTLISRADLFVRRLFCVGAPHRFQIFLCLFRPRRQSATYAVSTAH
jgi:hypothetical protein